MRKKDVLVAEAEAPTAVSIQRCLEAEDDFVVRIVTSGAAALRTINASPPDALLLDTNLSDVSTADICRRVRARERTAQLPLILLGTHGVGPSLVDGLELGADDYVPKPFDVSELRARLKAVLRRHVHQPVDASDDFRGAHLEARFADVHVAVDGHAVMLTRPEFQLLRALVRHRNDVLAREQLLVWVWGDDACDVRIVDSAMCKLRSKLGDVGRQIETVTGFGYRFNEPIK